MSIEKIMHKDMVRIEKEKNVEEAAILMADKKIGALVVTNGGEDEGIFTERDILMRVVATKKVPAQTSVGDVMTAPFMVIPATAEADQALKTMMEKKFRHLPVADDNGKLVGMVGVRDIMAFLVQQLESENQSLEAMLTADGFGG